MRNEITFTDCFAEPKADFQTKKIKVRKGPLEMPPEQRPRERLADKGPQTLSDADLLAILLNTGIKGKNVSELARELLNLLNGSREIPSLGELSRLSGMGNSKACAVAAMLEFGRRRWGMPGHSVKHPADVFALVRHNADRKQERFFSVSLNGSHEVLAVRLVTVGLVNRTIVHPREVFADLIQDRASAFAVAHNHPSGRLSPSPQDAEITERLRHASIILGINFMDHLIFSPTDYYSFRDNGRLNAPPETPFFGEDEDFDPGFEALLDRL